MRSLARKANNEQKNMAGERNWSWRWRSVRRKKKKDEQKGTVRRRNWETEEFVVAPPPSLPPSLVICSFDIIAASYSEAHHRTYLADYLSTDSASLIPLLSSYPVPVSFSAPPEILPLYTSFFVTLASKNATCPIDEPVSSRVQHLLLSTLRRNIPRRKLVDYRGGAPNGSLRIIVSSKPFGYKYDGGRWELEETENYEDPFCLVFGNL